MNAQKILVLVSLVLAIVAAFVNIPYVAAAFAILGLVIGWFIPGEDHVRVIASAVFLAVGADALGEIPAIGDYLTAIVGNVGAVIGAGAVMIIGRNAWKRAMG